MTMASMLADGIGGHMAPELETGVFITFENRRLLTSVPLSLSAQLIFDQDSPIDTKPRLAAVLVGPDTDANDHRTRGTRAFNANEQALVFDIMPDLY